jgi:cysteinyl-tRNA synthetase
MGTWAEVGYDFSSFEALLGAARDDAMVSKDFGEVDRLKAAFLAAGVEVRMSKAGVELLAGPGFDAGKLEMVV